MLVSIQLPIDVGDLDAAAAQSRTAGVESRSNEKVAGPILGSGLDENGVVACREFSQALRSALLAFRAAVTARAVDGRT
jgi:hypothetical protein